MADPIPVVDLKAVAQNWARRGFGCDLWTDPPGQVWKDYVHEVDELLMLVEGRLRFEMSGRSWEPTPGEEIYIPAGAVHSVENVGTTTARWLYGYKSKAL